MNIRLFILFIFFFPALKVAGDIAPNPIKAKGIITSGSFDIALKWEKVVVDLYKDSSVVQCQFFLENSGERRKVNIGFPEMNFYHFTLFGSPKKLPGTFIVHEDGRKIDGIEIFMPGQDTSRQNQISSEGNNSSEKPWLLWDSQFEENSTRMITVRYSLPYGSLKNSCRYFTYLLSTGSGWKGNIDSAEVIVNLRDIDYDLIIQSTPSGFTREGNRLKWQFTGFEPTTEDDIRIMYEPVKGDYEKIMARKPPVWIFDGIKTEGISGLVEPGDILSIRISNDPEVKAKYSIGNEKVFIIISKDYAIRQFIDQVLSKKLKSHNISYLPNYQFVTKYDLKIDEKLYEGTEMLRQLPEIMSEEIRRIRLLKNDERSTIYLLTSKAGK